MRNLSGMVRAAVGDHPARAARVVRAAAERVLGQEPSASLLSLALAAVVGAASLGAMHAASPAVSTTEPQRPHVTVRAELPERHRIAQHTLQHAVPMPERDDLTVYILSTEAEAEQFRARIDEENRTLDVLQRPQVHAEAVVASTADDLISIYRALCEMDALRGIAGQSPINIIDMQAL
jgi:hypothetical protein